VLATFWAVWRAFGGLAASLAFAFSRLSFFARFDFIGGSPLRWDWICALLLGAAPSRAALHRGRPRPRLRRPRAHLPALFLLPLAANGCRRATRARAIRGSLGVSPPRRPSC